MRFRLTHSLDLCALVHRSSPSFPMASISSESSIDNPLVEQEEIAALTLDVRDFKESLGKLRRTFNPDKEKKETVSIAAHERLGEVLRILRSFLEKYPVLQSSEILVSVGILIQHVKGHSSEHAQFDPTDCFDVIDQLALAFSSRVSEYLMGDLDLNNISLSSTMSTKPKPCDNLLADVENATELHSEKKITLLSPQEIESLLLKLQQEVDLALHRAKQWAKYAKDIMMYVEQRTHLELEHARNLSKLAHTLRPAIKEEKNVPLQSMYCSALNNDVDNSSSNQVSCNLVLGNKFLEPLGVQRSEHERTRKKIKELWHRELTHMYDTISRIRQAHNTYQHHQRDWEKLKGGYQRAVPETHEEVSSEKRHIEDDSLLRVIESESSYNACVVEINDNHEHLLRIKADILQQVQDLIEQSDEVIKTVTIMYFQMQQTLTAPWANQFQVLCDTSRLYEPGSQHMEFMKWLPTSSYQQKETLQPSSEQTAVVMEQEHHERKSTESIDSEYLFQENFYLPISGHAASKASETHTFRNLKTPARCRECDSYVYFQGVDCSECGLSCHKKCLYTLAIQCGHKRLPSKMTTFGIDLGQHLTETTALVPHIVCKCVDEIENRGKLIKGIYRVSGVKSRVEKLCQAFENGADLVDLTDIHPNVISNVLKLYLRQLPEPLLTLQLYPEFVKIAREYPSNCAEDIKIATDFLKSLVKKLPRHHYLTLALLMQHLKRVSDESSVNNMPPSNLGIVFGPTLLRTSEGSASLSSLVDTIHQTRAIELMIREADNIFCAREVARARDYGADWGSKSELIGFGLYRSFSFMDRWKKPNELPDLCKLKICEKGTTALPEMVKKNDFVETAGTETRSESESDDELTYFLLKGDHGRSKLSLTSNTPKIFKGSLKDYQGLEGVSLTLLGSTQSSEGSENAHQRLCQSISDTSPSLHNRDNNRPREGSSTSETFTAANVQSSERKKSEEWKDHSLRSNTKPFPKLGQTSKTNQNKQRPESSVDSDYSFESHASSCDLFLEPPSTPWSRTTIGASHDREKDHLDYFAYIPVYQTHPNSEDSSNLTTSLEDHEVNSKLEYQCVGAKEEETSSTQLEASTTIDRTFITTSFHNSYRQTDKMVDVDVEVPVLEKDSIKDLQLSHLAGTISHKCHENNGELSLPNQVTIIDTSIDGSDSAQKSNHTLKE